MRVMPVGPNCTILYAQSHDRINYVVVVLFQCLDSLVSRDACLGHDKLNILIFETGSIDFLSIIFIVIFFVLASFNGLALSIVIGVVMARVVMTGVVVRFLSS
jgi:hypothetical protein